MSQEKIPTEDMTNITEATEAAESTVGFLSSIADQDNNSGDQEVFMKLGTTTELACSPSDIEETSLENGTLVITLKNGNEIIVTNFEELAEGAGGSTLQLIDGTPVTLESVQGGSFQVAEVTGDAITVQDTNNVIQPPQDAMVDPNAPAVEEVTEPVAEPEEITEQEETILEEVLEETAEVIEEEEGDVEGDTSAAAGEVSNIEPAAGEVADTIEETAEAAPTQTEAVEDLEEEQLAEIARELAEVEPAAGDQGGLSVRGGFGFDSGVDAVSIPALNDIGPINPTALQYGIPSVEDDTFIIQTSTPADIPPLGPPTIVTSFDNGDPDFANSIDADSGLVKEDGSITLNLIVNLPTVAGTVLGNETLTVTISDLDPSFNPVLNAPVGAVVTPNGATGYTIVMPEGVPFAGTIVFTPPAESDVDHPTFTIEASVSDPEFSEPSTATTSLDIVVDAVADEPVINADDGSNFINNDIDVDVVGMLGTDNFDGSEEITGYEISGVPDGFIFNQGTNNGGGVWSFTPSEISGLTITPPADYVGTIDLVATVFNEETVLSGDEADSTDNTNSASDPFALTWVKGPVVVYEFGNSVDADTGLVKEDGSVDMFVFVENTDPVGPVAGDEVLTVTISDLDPAWNITLPTVLGQNFAPTGNPNEFSITLPAGADFNGVITFEPPAQSDADHPTFTISAEVTDPVLASSSSDSATADIVTDAVADEPEVNAEDASNFINNDIDVDVAGMLGDDTDGSEEITGYEISGVPDGFTFNQGTNNGGGVWSFTPAEISGLTITPPTDYVGTINLVATVFNEETNLTDTEVDTGDNTNSATDPFALTWVKGPVVVYEFGTQVDGDTGLVKEDSNVDLFISVDNTTAVGPVAGDEELTVTVTLPTGTGWTITSVDFTETSPGVWQTNLAPGQSLVNGIINFAPPADSDEDFPQFTIEAEIFDPVLNVSESDSATADIWTDAVIDAPTLAVNDVTGEEGTEIDLDITIVDDVDVDGSETLVVEISGLPTGVTLNSGTFDNGTNTWTVPLADVSSLKANVPDGQTTFSFTVTVTDTEAVQPGDAPGNNEVDYSDNQVVLTETVRVKVTPDTVPTADPDPVTVDEDNLPTKLTQTGDLNIDFKDDAQGGTFVANGNAPAGLTSGGLPVTVTNTNNVYTGTINNGADVVFTLTLNPDGTYTYEQCLPLDHAEGTPTDDTLPLEFGITVTDGDGDEITTTVTVSVIDDNPDARDDYNDTSAKGETTTSGNVITGENGGPGADDILSADVPNKVTKVNGTDVPENGTVDIPGTYGTLTIDADGNYTYTADPQLVNPGPYEFSNTETFPNLQSGQMLVDTDTLGLDQGDLDIDFDAMGTVEFVSEGAGFNNTLGMFYVDANGDIVTSEILIENGNNVGADALTNFTVDGSTNQSLGFFLIADGFDTNNQYSGLDLENGELNFVYKYGTADERPANVSDDGNEVSLVFTDNGNDTVLQGPIYFTTERGGSDNLNADSSVRVVSGLADPQDPTVLRIGFEDLPRLGDKDYEDLIFDVTITPKGCDPFEEVFNYTLADQDGDTDTANLTIKMDICDDAPVLTGSTVQVDETNITDTANNVVTVDFGNDTGDGNGITGNDVFNFGGSVKDGTLTRNGEDVEVNLVGNKYVGKTVNTDVTVFELTVNSDGSYEFKLFENLDHADGNDPNDIITLNFGVQATDSTGDTGTATISVDVLDDIPSANSKAGRVFEKDLRNDGTIVKMRNIPNLDFGEDGAGEVLPSRFIAKFQVGGPDAQLQSNGVDIDVEIVGNSFVGKAGATTVFTLEVNPLTGKQTYTQFEGIDHQDASNPDDVIWLKFYFNVIDDDGDSVEVLSMFDVHDDAPIAVDDGEQFAGDETAGNVLENDIESGDVPTTVKSVSANGNPVTTLVSGPTVIEGSYGQLMISENGDFTYTLYQNNNGEPGQMFCLNPCEPDTRGTQTSIARDGITVSIANPGNADIVWVGQDGSGLGINNLDGSDTQKVFEQKVNGSFVTEAFDVSFDENVEEVTFTIADIGSNNLNKNQAIDYTITFEDGTTVTEESDQFVTGNVDNYIFEFSLNAADYGGKLISSVELSSSSFAGDFGRSSFLLNNVKAKTPDVDPREYDVFEYTIADADGDMSSAYIFFNAGNGQVIEGNLQDNLTGTDGDDLIYAGSNANDITGGAGSDVFLLLDQADGFKTITDFNEGEGDILDLAGMVEFGDDVTDSITDFVKFTEQGGANTVVSIDADGADNGQNFTDVAVLEGVTDLDLEALFNNGNVAA